jgi:hypothetical protein
MDVIDLMRPSGAADARDLDRLVHDGLVRVVAADVHAAADLPDERAVRAAAVRLLVPDRLVALGAVLSGPGAAWLYAGGPAPRRLHVTLPVGRGRAGTPDVVVHEGRVRPGDVQDVDRVPVVVPARAAADVARLLPAERALPLLDRLAAAVRVDPREVLVHLERLGGCRGVEEGRRVVLGWRRPHGRAP